jgi:hypothetical protein
VSRVVRIKIHNNISGGATMNDEALFIIQGWDATERTCNIVSI